MTSLEQDADAPTPSASGPALETIIDQHADRLFTDSRQYDVCGVGAAFWVNVLHGTFPRITVPAT